MKNLLLSSSLVLAFILASCTIFSKGTTVQEINDHQPELIVVKFHADWCGSCRALGPALTDLSNKLDGQSVLFTELNFTNNTTKHQANLLAGAMGIDNIVAENNGTGFILVIDGDTKEVKSKLTKDMSVKEMSKNIASFL